jgi:hypothetical protein
VSFVIPPPYLQLLPAAVTFNRKVFWIWNKHKLFTFQSLSGKRLHLIEH